MNWIGITGSAVLVAMCIWIVLTIPIKPLQWGLTLFAIPCALYFLYVGFSRHFRINEPALTLFRDRMVVRLFRPTEVMFADVASAEISGYASSGVPNLVLQLSGMKAGKAIAINLSPIKSDDQSLLAEVRKRIAAAHGQSRASAF